MPGGSSMFDDNHVGAGVAAAAAARNATGVVLPPAWMGFGTAGLGEDTYPAVAHALRSGFRAFDTAEESEAWYDPSAVGRALRDHYYRENERSEKEASPSSPSKPLSCRDLGYQISTKISPWDLTSIDRIRDNARTSRQQLLGFCPPDETEDDDDDAQQQQRRRPYPLDIYYIHAPTCTPEWHERCASVKPGDLLDLRSAWLGMEAVVGIDRSARRIGLSNVQPAELLDLIRFVQRRQKEYSRGGETHETERPPPPRMPDAVQNYADPIEAERSVRKICHEHNITFVSYSTLGTQHATEDDAGDTDRRGGGTKNPVLDAPLIKRIANKHSRKDGIERSTAEVVLSWAIQNGMCVIPRSSDPEHIEQLARLLPPAPEAAASEDDDSQNHNNNKLQTFLDEWDLINIDSMRSDVKTDEYGSDDDEFLDDEDDFGDDEEEGEDYAAYDDDTYDDIEEGEDDVDDDDAFVDDVEDDGDDDFAAKYSEIVDDDIPMDGDDEMDEEEEGGGENDKDDVRDEL